MAAGGPHLAGALPHHGAGRQSRAFPLLRGLVEAPILGPLLYRLNTTRSVLGWMSRRHVAGPGLTPPGISERQRIARPPGARFASAAFVTGGLDPYGDPEGWLRAARGLEAPLTVAVAGLTIASSWAPVKRH